MADAQDDDLYAHSDNENLSDAERLALSPSDGYFTSSLSVIADGAHEGDRQGESIEPSGAETRSNRMPRNHMPRVPNRLVEDPTLRQTHAEDKAAEAQSERMRTRDGEVAAVQDQQRGEIIDNNEHGATSDPEVQTSSTPHEDARAIAVDTEQEQTAPPPLPLSTRTESTPPPRQERQYVYADAPPAYTPSPTTAMHNASMGLPRAGDSAQNQAEPNERDPLLAADLAQTPVTPFAESPSQRMLRMRVCFWKTRTGKTRKTTVVVLTMFVVAVIIATIVAIISISSAKQARQDFIEEPVKEAQPQNEDPLVWLPQASCRPGERTRYGTRIAYDFNVHDGLVILQLPNNASVAGSVPIRTFGHVILQADANPGFSTGFIAVESLSNDVALVTQLKHDRASNIVKIVSPSETVWESDKLDPCIQMRIVIGVPLNARLQFLTIETEHLDIKIGEGLIVSVTEVAQLMAMEGNVEAPDLDDESASLPYQLHASDLVAQSVKSNLRGWYPIYDSLVLATREGAVSAVVTQKQMKKGVERSSKLTAMSSSGNISLREATSSAQSPTRMRRDHVLVVETASGDIYAQTRMASNSMLSTTTGNINLSAIAPTSWYCSNWGRQHCQLTTGTLSGSTTIALKQVSEFNDGIRYDGASGSHEFDYTNGNVTNLVSTHISRTGDIEATYPASWQGSILAATDTGSMEYIGKGLVLKPIDSITKRLKGKLGDGDSMLMVNTGAGDQRITLGEA